MPQVLHAVRTRSLNSGITFHHDNAPAHTAAATREFLACEGVQLMSHPTYSPDLAPCDFFLFPHAKKQLWEPVMTVPRTRSEPSQGLLTI